MPKITKRVVENVKPGPSDVFLWDGETRGFGVRVKPSGRRSYIVQYRTLEGVSRRMTLGPHGVLTVTAARREAQQILAAVRRGVDPARDRLQGRRAPTVAELCERYLIEHARPHKKPRSAEEDERLIRLHVLPALGRRKVDGVARTDILRLHHSMRDRPGAANRTLALVSTMFNLAERWDLRPDNTNPTRHVKKMLRVNANAFCRPRKLGAWGMRWQQPSKRPLFRRPRSRPFAFSCSR